MDLRNGHPYWLIKNGLLSTYPSLKEDIECDVAIIGAGITGALVAHALSRGGAATVVLDKRDVGTGSTAASTSLLQYAADVEMVDLAARIGEESAVRTYQLGLEAIDRLEKLIGQLDDHCDFERKYTLYRASTKKDVEKLRRECDLQRRHGFDIEFLDSHALERRFPFRAPAALLCSGDAQVDAVRLTHATLRQAARQGTRIFDRSDVTEIRSLGDRVRLTVDRVHNVLARRIVFATGYESGRYLRQKVGTLHSTFALITEPIENFPQWPDRCLIWESARPYTYFRATRDNRILVGGGDVPFATAHKQHSLIKAKAKSLERQFRRTFPDCEFERAFAWGGTFGATEDGLPYIGLSPEWTNAYFALGYGGNGITMSMIAANIIVDLYHGRRSPDARLYRFDREH